MILGTYANLGAIDAQQSGANQITIDRLPDIHITNSNENIFATPPNILEPKEKIEIGPQLNNVHETNPKSKGSKRKMTKSTKLKPEPTEIVREINLIDKNKPGDSPKLNKKDEESVVLAKGDSAPLSSNTDVVQPAQIADKPNANIVNQLVQPNTMIKSADSLINNDAIRKEEQEIEINAKEQRQNDVKRTQEILDVVKNQLTKQNEENQRIVLQKINEISDKVDSIQSKVERPAQSNVDPIVLDAHTETTNNKNNEINSHAKPSVDNNDEMTNILSPPDPIAKLLVDRKSSSLPIRMNESIKTESENIPKKESIIIPEKIAEANNELPRNDEKPIEKQIENVGRDLLSNSNDFQTEQSNINNSLRGRS